MSHNDGGEDAAAAAPAAASGAANVGAIYAATIKLPDFWQHNPQPWFQHIEAQFQLRGITRDATKYFHVVAALDASTTARAMALLETPPVDGKYDALKTFLLSLFELSELEKADRLLSLNGLGDGKPSELMERMLAVLGSADPSFLFAHIFLRQLPAPVRTALASFSPPFLQRLPGAGCGGRQDFPRQPAEVCPCAAAPPAHVCPVSTPDGRPGHRSCCDVPPTA